MNNGVSFEYKINNDVKRSRLSVSLYIVIKRRNGFIEEDLIATSKPTKYTKYKKGETDADSLGYVSANLRAGGLKTLIAESRDLILYRYSEVIDPDKVTERFTDNSPSGVTREAAAYIPQTESESKKRKPNNLVELLSGRDNQDQNQSFRSKSGSIEIVKGESNWLTNADASRTVKNQSDGFGSVPAPNQPAQPATPTDNKSNVSTDFSVANLDKNNELMKVSQSKGDINNTTINNNNQSNAITSSSTNTFSEVSDNSSTITDLYKSKSNYEYILDKKNRDKYTAETLKIAKTELANVDATIKKEITKYNKAHPGDNKYKTEAEVKKEQLKEEAQTKKKDSEKDEKPAGVEKAMAKLAEANKLPESPKIENTSASKIDKIKTTVKDAKLPEKSTPAAITKETDKSSDGDLANKIISNITKPLEFTSKVFDKPTEDLIKDDSNITLKAEKEETNKAVKAGTAVKKEVIDVKKLNPNQATANQIKQNANLAELKNYASTIATNTSNTINNTSNNKTDNNNAAAATEIKLDNTQPLKHQPKLPKSNKPKEGSEPVDNSQSELNSQLLNAIYDLLSTGIKVKYS